jgi:hypothetical protein
MFLLDSNKLTRIQDILTERLKRNDGPPRFRCDVTFKNNTSDRFETITDVLALDNTKRNPITSLTVIAQTSDHADSPAACTVEFIGGTKSSGSSAAKDNIRLLVEGENQITKSEMFAAVEEQVERTIASPWPVVAVALAFIAAVVIATFVTGILGAPGAFNSTMYAPDVAKFDQLASEAKTSDEKLSFLFELARHEIHERAKLYAPVHWDQIATFSGILRLTVILGVLGMLAYMLLFCFPVNVFLWGDYGEHYARLRERRIVIRNVIVTALLIGVLANLISAELWQHYHAKQP